MRRSAGSTTVIVLTLAVAMGTSAVLFTVVDTVLQSVPARDRSRVVSVSSTDPRRGRMRIGASPADFVDWKERSRSFESLGAISFGTLNLTGIDTPLRVRTAKASVDVFPALGIEPTIGRTFRPDEDRAGGNHVVLLSNRFWQRQFAGAPTALGTTITLDGDRYGVVGVMSARIEIGALRQVDVWVPLAIDRVASPRDQRSLYVFGRLEPGVTRQQGGAEMATIAGQLAQTYPTTNSGVGVVVEPAIEGFGGGGGVRFVLALLMLMAALLVAVACANVANVILARAASRRRELAVRAAIGAGRMTLVRQLLIEDGVLSVLGGAAGLLLCAWEVDAVKTIAGTEMPIFSAMTVDGRVLLFALVMAVIAPLAFGFVPALRASAPDLREGLKDGARSVAGNARGRRMRAVLVGAQVAATVALLVEVGALVRTTLTLHRTEKGFDADNLLTLRVDLPESKYRDPQRAHDFFDALTSRLMQLPGVGGAAAIDRLPIADRERPMRFAIQGKAAPSTGEEPCAAIASVGPGYFRTMRIPLLGGREFSAGDPADAARVALVSRLAANRYWPRGDAVGQRVRLASDDAGGRWIDIVGIVGDVRNSDADAGPIPQIYLPHAQRPSRAMAIVVRGGTDVVSLAGAIRREVLGLDRDQPIYDVKTMERVLFEDLADIYILVSMLVALAVIALGLAAAGTYGVIAYGVTQRTSEIGVRMALGAEAADVVRMVVTQGLAPVVAGASVGFAFGFALVRVTASALQEVTSRDPATYVIVSVLVGASALLASYLPARRATRIDPVAALRAE